MKCTLHIESGRKARDEERGRLQPLTLLQTLQATLTPRKDWTKMQEQSNRWNTSRLLRWHNCPLAHRRVRPGTCHHDSAAPPPDIPPASRRRSSQEDRVRVPQLQLLTDWAGHKRSAAVQHSQLSRRAPRVFTWLSLVINYQDQSLLLFVCRFLQFIFVLTSAQPGLISYVKVEEHNDVKGQHQCTDAGHDINIEQCTCIYRGKSTQADCHVLCLSCK